jgi:branched-chain amino acid transport system permease protein
VALTAAASTIETEDGPGAAPGGTRVRRVRTVATSLAPALAIVLVQQVVFPAPGGIVLRGVIVGGLTALIALGMALVHRANRIINFAQADLGFAPAVLAYLLLDEVGVPWPLAVVAGLATAVVLGAATEVLVIRRFARAPRLLVTIATIGLSQVLTAVALLLPRLWDRRLVSDRIAPPWDATARLGGVVFDANDLLALVVTPVVVVGVAGLLRGSAAGVAIRASADDGDRASLLGIPVHRLHTIVWAGAAALAFVTVFLRGGILGLPTGEVLGFSVLLRSLVALVLGRLTNLVTVTTSAVALGVLELGIAWDSSVELIDPALGAIVLLALLLQGRRSGEGGDADGGAWRAAEEVRRLPDAVSALPVVRWGRPALLAGVVAVAAVVPHLLSSDRSLRASALLIYATLGLSLVLLSGWGGHVSLGQVAFFAVGAAVGAWATSTLGADLFAALVVAAVAGAAAATLVGVPASRARGSRSPSRPSPSPWPRPRTSWVTTSTPGCRGSGSSGWRSSAASTPSHPRPSTRSPSGCSCSPPSPCGPSAAAGRAVRRWPCGTTTGRRSPTASTPPACASSPSPSRAPSPPWPGRSSSTTSRPSTRRATAPSRT